MASLGFAAVGFFAAFRSFDMRLAAILAPCIFTLGAAIGHAREMVTAHNFSPGNAGVMFYADILVPLLGFWLLWANRSYPAHHASQNPYTAFPAKTIVRSPVGDCSAD